ncbi:hypothetical protein QJS83_17035 [Bdellovibrio sp. 22V]|uniref:hypothetical protein n=1 Tax=Bdellovibrio sp. 22V TaxID=3044166 RepID=UPI0025430A7A|nr:hypothetical protein [Bdellovibrio sp. 22V]WII72170.1 hypothetical protein QJS83_17035 [Bdellovibrio sp. 22V]
MKTCPKCNQSVDRDCPLGMKRIFAPSITKNGKTIYPANKSCFVFCVPHHKA